VEERSSKTLPEAEIIRRALEERGTGQVANSYEELVRRYQDRLYNFLLHKTGDADKAEDIAQEAFKKAFERLYQFRGESGFYTWVCRIALNELSNRQRKRQHEVLLGLETEGGGQSAIQPAEERRPEEPVERREIRERVRAAIRKLPDEFRAAVELVDIAGLSYKEAAEVLGVPEGTIKSRLARGRRQLKEELKDLVEVEQTTTEPSGRSTATSTKESASR